MTKTSAQLDREIAEALSAPRRSGGIFVQRFAARIDQDPLLLLEMMRNEVERYAVTPTRDKLVKKVSAEITWQLIHHGTKGPEFFAWLEGLMGHVAATAGRGSLETLTVDRVYLDSEDPFLVSVRFIGDTQDPDTEVPAYLSHRDLSRALMQLGGKGSKTSCDWRIREIGEGYDRDLRTVYECRATFPMKTLASDVFGPRALETAAEKALAED